jgi:hypothetical protein
VRVLDQHSDNTSEEGGEQEGHGGGLLVRFTRILYTDIAVYTGVCFETLTTGGSGLCCSVGGLESEYTQTL